MLGPWGWLTTLGYLIGSAVVYIIAVLAFCGLLIGLADTETEQHDVIGFTWIMLYIAIGLVPIGNIIWWWIRWASYNV